MKRAFIVIVVLSIGVPWVLVSGSWAGDASTSKTLGFVLTGRHVAMVETPGAKLECPEGFQFDSLSDNWKAQFPTEAAQREQQKRCGSRDNRGPNCENTIFNPKAVRDTLPFRETQAKTAYGMNLDGTTDGSATPRTCTHQKFTAPDGRQDIDNQFYRAMGCELKWRNDGIYEMFGNRVELIDRTSSRVLLEISGVDDERNDPDVDVAIYKGMDYLQKDAASNVQPWQNQRIDERVPQYEQHVHGKIVDGVLITQPMEVRLPSMLMGQVSDLQLSEMRLQLTLAPTGAHGIMAGYHDVDEYWTFYSKTITTLLSGYPVSAPAKYAAFHRLADGLKDPATGECKGMSAAYELDWTRVFIVHPEGEKAAAASLDHSQLRAAAR